MEQLNLLTGETKREESIRFLREHEPPEGYFLGFSGGKDSQVTYHLALEAGVKFQAYYSKTGIDAPEVVHFIRDHYPDVIHCRPNESFFKLIPKNGYPNKWSRWCCNYLKKDPTKHIPLKHRLMGIRAEESTRRASRSRIDKLTKRMIHYKPIFGWLEWEVWEYIESNALLYCSLYDEGFDRLGCVVCPFLSEAKHRIHNARWPKIYNAFEKAMIKLWDTGRIEKRGYDKNFDEFLSNWYKGK